MRQSVLISFEGGDGAGKTTLLEAVYHALSQEGLPVLRTKAPGGTPLGEEIRNLLLHGVSPLDRQAELFLFLADRAQHVSEVIRPALQAGQIVLTDRFNDSTITYQGARGLDPVFVRSLCLLATQGLEPDLTFYLDIDPQEGLLRAQTKRGAQDRIEAAGLEFHQQIREAFLKLAHNQSRFCILDASLSQEVLLQQALARLL